jgi:hypothetical protein
MRRWRGQNQPRAPRAASASPHPPCPPCPPGAAALADFARSLQLSTSQRTAGAYLDTLQRLLAFGLDPLQAERVR